MGKSKPDIASQKTLSAANEPWRNIPHTLAGSLRETSLPKAAISEQVARRRIQGAPGTSRAQVACRKILQGAAYTANAKNVKNDRVLYEMCQRAFRFLLMSQSMSEWMFRPILVMLYKCSLATSQTISQIALSE
jgi:hypothetical protein